MARFWLLKSEPSVFSIDDLAKSPKQTTCWEGVRNYQARNFMRAMEVGDSAFFYHSSTEPPAIVGRVRVTKGAYPDVHAWDPRSKYFDPKSTKELPRWWMVDVRYEEKFKTPLALDSLRSVKGLEHMELLRKGSRLSVQPVRESEWNIILRLTKVKDGKKGS